MVVDAFACAVLESSCETRSTGRAAFASAAARISAREAWLCQPSRRKRPRAGWPPPAIDGVCGAVFSQPCPLTSGVLLDTLKRFEVASAWYRLLCCALAAARRGGRQASAPLERRRPTGRRAMEADPNEAVHMEALLCEVSTLLDEAVGRSSTTPRARAARCSSGRSRRPVWIAGKRHASHAGTPASSTDASSEANRRGGPSAPSCSQWRASADALRFLDRELEQLSKRIAANAALLERVALALRCGGPAGVALCQHLAAQRKLWESGDAVAWFLRPSVRLLEGLLAEGATHAMSEAYCTTIGHALLSINWLRVTNERECRSLHDWSRRRGPHGNGLEERKTPSASDVDFLVEAGRRLGAVGRGVGVAREVVALLCCLAKLCSEWAAVVPRLRHTRCGAEHAGCAASDAYPSGWFHARAKRRPRGDGGRSESSDDDDEERDEEMEERSVASLSAPIGHTPDGGRGIRHDVWCHERLELAVARAEAVRVKEQIGKSNHSTGHSTQIV